MITKASGEGIFRVRCFSMKVRCYTTQCEGSVGVKGFLSVPKGSPLDVHVRNEAGAGPKRGEHGTVHVAPRPRLDAAAHVGEER